MLCHYVIAKLVISLFPKVGDLQKPWVSVVNAIKTENKAWIPGAPDVVCQRHFTDSDYRPIEPFGE